MKTTKNILKNALPFPIALLATLAISAISAPAEAFNIMTPRTVWIQGGGLTGFVNGGTWTLTDLDENIPGYCRYNLEWVSAGPSGLTVSANVYIDEAKTPGHLSCSINRFHDFATSIYLAPGPAVTGPVPPAPPSQGIDRFGQLVAMSFLSLSESPASTGGPALQGTVRYAIGGVYAIRMF